MCLYSLTADVEESQRVCAHLAYVLSLYMRTHYHHIVSIYF